ncbi:DUF397 domain-containing protein [Streptomyces sp. URMC 129]|uniref:DUF397 domain-containing protein n=1 Tax=Streptomyces sp. URMC 129 TaxID=3423407 RepID=UPI003F1A9242
MAGLEWHKSTFSGPDGNKECIELAARANALLIRESDEPETVLTTDSKRLAALLAAVKAGRIAS